MADLSNSKSKSRVDAILNGTIDTPSIEPNTPSKKISNLP